MNKLTLLITVAAAALTASLISSCGCCAATSEVPPLRPAPSFIDSAPVQYYK